MLTTDREKAAEKVKAIAPRIAGFVHSGKKVGNADGTPRDSNYRRLYRATRERARRKGIEFTLTDAEFAAIVEDSGGRCALTGIPFSTLKRNDWFRAPYAPSLDRIEPKKGYVDGNVRLLCVAANWALQDWGVDVFKEIALGFLVGYSGDKMARFHRRCREILSPPAP